MIVRDHVLAAERGAQLADERSQVDGGGYFTTIHSRTGVDCR